MTQDLEIIVRFDATAAAKGAAADQAAQRAQWHRGITRSVEAFMCSIVDELPPGVRLLAVETDPPIPKYRCRTCGTVETEHAFDSCEGGPDGWEAME